MKIAVIGTRGFPRVQGGVENHCEQLYPRLARSGCEVIVFTRRPYVDTTRAGYEGVRFVHVPCVKNIYLEAVLHTFVGVLCAAFMRPDVLHVHAIGPALFVPLARICGLNVVMTHHGPEYQRQKWGATAKAVLRIGEQCGVRFAHAVIAVSMTIADDIKRRYNRQAVMIPNGVNPARRVAENGTLSRFGLQKGKYVLSVGRFVPEKGFLDLIEAFDGLVKEAPWVRANDWKLALVGQADHPSDYSRQIAEKAKANQRIVLTGFLTGDDLREIFTNAGMFILASHYEGLPLALLEALSYGIVCAASDIKAHREIGLFPNNYFTAGAAEEIKRIITRCAQERPEPAELAAQATRVQQRFNWDAIALQTQEVYRRVCSGGGDTTQAQK